MSKHYIEPKPGSLEMRTIRTPCILKHIDEIDPTYPTQEDNKVEEAGCPECKSDTIFATIGVPYYNTSHWHCAICGHAWDTPRGIIVQQTLF